MKASYSARDDAQEVLLIKFSQPFIHKLRMKYTAELN